MTIAGGELRASDERDAARFFPTDSCPDETSEQDRERVADALADQERAILRVQPSQPASKDVSAPIWVRGPPLVRENVKRAGLSRLR